MCCFDTIQFAGYSQDDQAKWEHWQKEDVVVGDTTFKNWLKKAGSDTVGQTVEKFNRGLEDIAVNHFNWLHQVQKFRHLNPETE